VVTSADYDFGQVDPEVQVLVMDAETRHLSSGEAYDIVYDITKRAIAQKIPYLYKKTDSALRGNIGSELTAMLEAAEGKTLSFLPAFPKMKRWTKEGIHYIDGVPVSESVFGKDPFEPVICSDILQMIESQSRVKVSVRSALSRNAPAEGNGEANIQEPELLVWDSETDEELDTLGQYLYEKDMIRLTAGCAGFAAVLPGLLGLKGERRPAVKLNSKLLVICGSVNPITAAQLDYAEKHGFLRIRLKPEERLDRKFWAGLSGQEKLRQWKELLTRHSFVILDSNDLPGRENTLDYAEKHELSLDEIRIRIAASYGYILRFLLEGGLESTLMITGGDTLLGCMEELGVREMEPVCELAPGTVLSSFSLGEKQNQVISKSGGFGEETLLVDLAIRISGTKKKKPKKF
jgi:uncharacterized protein YgbK (DUF1537 family)